MKKIIPASICYALISVFVACKKHDDSGQGPNDIYLEYKLFHPGQLLIATGTTVNFINKDGSSHTVQGGLFQSGTIKPAATYSYNFTAAGTYFFSCGFHSQNQNEQVYIKVQ